MTTPSWAIELAQRAAATPLTVFDYPGPADGEGRTSAVLVLLAPEGRILLEQRAEGLANHGGQVSFPGGALEPQDTGVTDAALREAGEEVGLGADTVSVLSVGKELWIPHSGFRVVPIIGWTDSVPELAAVDPAEVADVFWVGLNDLARPDHRVQVMHPGGLVGPGFVIGDNFIWGFTAGMIARLLELAGLEQPWQSSARHYSFLGVAL